ncbi:MAG: hypothetical protein NC118_10955 [Eubacterium sp.]|nr:hypothetical protein [Eubacterium sp.]
MSRVLPILFNTDMVRAILDGRKTVTRRIYKDKDTERICPIRPGDILYVRETWAFIPCIRCNGEYTRPGAGMACYDTQAVEYGISDGCFVYRADCKNTKQICWRPSIHMPKEAARIWLKVIDVRAERLQNIRNFREEGIKLSESCEECYIACGGCDSVNSPTGCDNEIEAFINLWDSTIKKADINRYGWQANPFVWVIEFERCGKPEEYEGNQKNKGVNEI